MAVSSAALRSSWSGLAALGLAAVLAGAPVPAPARSAVGEHFTDVAGIRLGGVTLAGMRDRYGRAPLVHRGDAGGSTTSICYRVGHGGTTTFLSGELGGRAMEVLGVEVAADGQRRGCAVPTRRAALLTRLPAGIAIGQSAAAFAAVTGARPASTPSSTATKVFSSQIVRGGQVIDSTITLEGRFAHGRLSRFTVYRVLTN